MGVFKAYDVRGKYPSEIDESLALRLGAAVVQFLKAKRIAIGRDVRTSAPAIASAVAVGARSAGAEVVDIGLCTTPMTYFAVGSLGLDGGIMVTASHNPPDYIGFKICREKAAPIGEATGLKDIEKLALSPSSAPTLPPSSVSASKEPHALLPEYRRHLLQYVGKSLRPLRVVVDTANGAVGTIFEQVFGSLPLAFRKLCFEPDGRFPNHEPNPLKDENIQDARKAVVDFKADLAVCFDGDGDRCMFLDSRGERVTSDLVTVLLARKELERRPGSAVVYDLRSSRVVAEEIAKAGGKPMRERVGHAFIKATMKKHDAVLGGELSGHYYFRDHYFADSGMMACAKLLDIVASQPHALHELVAPLKRYAATGEINFHVEDKAAAMERIASAFKDGKQDRLDGITIDYPEWWCNVRPSNTEPLLRLNLEATGPALCERMKARVVELIGGRAE
jgi:phosphomannomutase